MARIITFGEIMLRLKPPGNERFLQSPAFEATFGGGEANVAVALAYLGMDSEFITALPDNPMGHACRTDLRKYGVRTDHIVWIGGIVFLLYFAFYRFGITGRHIYAIGSNIKMSWMSGINVTKARNWAFALSGLGASAAAIMVSSAQYGSNPYLGETYILNSIAAVVVGGTALTGGSGGPLNTLLGALILSVMRNGMTVVGIDQYFQQSILGLMIVVAVVLTFDRQKTGIVK